MPAGVAAAWHGQAGLSKSWVQQLWWRNDLKPHQTRTFKVSNDQQFEQKFWDIVGLYLSPPQQAVVLCCDEKSQCQALERSQPGLPLGQGQVATRTHDYYRHGTRLCLPLWIIWKAKFLPTVRSVTGTKSGFNSSRRLIGKFLWI